MSLILAILAQIGPFPQPGMQPVSPLPPEIVERKRQESEAERQAESSAPAPAHTVSRRFADCLAGLEADPAEAAAMARKWLDRAKGAEKAEAGQCLGMALARMERWVEAEGALREALAATDADDHDRRARLAAMAGNAALARGDADAALEVLEAANEDAAATGNPFIAAAVAIDRSRALVMLGRNEEARDSLAQARRASPESPQAWLLSATLSRRMGELTMAQVEIEEAAKLQPTDPEIGLEAGVIAMLSGNETAARKSWQSVVAAAPDSGAARAARGYLAQLGEDEMELKKEIPTR